MLGPRRNVIVTTARSPWFAVAGLVAVACALGGGHVCARLAFTHGVTVLTAATVRSLSASALLLVLLAMRRMAPLPLPVEFRGTLVLGACVIVQTLFLQFAVTRLPVTLAILVFYTYPFLTSVATSLLGEHRLSAPLMAALLAAFAGLAMVLGVGNGPVDLLGVAAAFGASVGFTAALVLTPRLAPGLAAPMRTFYMMTTSAIVFVIAAGATQHFAWPTGSVAWTGLAGLSLLYAMGITGLFLLLPLLGPAQTAVVLNLEPVAVAAIAWVALGETLTPLQCVGALVVVVAVIAYQLRVRRGGRVSHPATDGKASRRWKPKQ